MALATYKDLCIDAVDAARMSRFWGAALHLEPQPRDDGLVELVGSIPEEAVWIVPVPEPVTVKQRAHVDVRAASAKDVEALGATVVDADSFPWVVMKDPEGGELCVFETTEKRHGLYELGIDTDGDPLAITIHFDVWGDVAGLEAKGATVLREPDDAIEWTIMVDPDGNEFCVFTRES